jgi:hydrogenase nickel incorporation protein HypA/HybF
MHEHFLLNDLITKIEKIAREYEADHVLGIKVKLGALSNISADHLKMHFEEAVKGTVAERADLKIEQLTDKTDPCAQDILLDSVEIEEH